MNIVLFGILAYVLVQFAVGTWVSRRMASEADYILAGRRLGVGLVTFSVFATYFGAEAIVASGGAVYEKGLAGALVDPIGYAGAIIIVGLLFARALWSRGLTTFADLFRRRYSPGVERLVVVMLGAGLDHLGRGPGARLRPGHEPQLRPRSQGGHHARRRAGGGLLGGRRAVGGRGYRYDPGHRGAGRPDHPRHHRGDRSGRRCRRPGKVEPARLLLHPPDESLLARLEQLAIPICGTIVAVELISRFLGARTAKVAGRGTMRWRRDLSARSG